MPQQHALRQKKLRLRVLLIMRLARTMRASSRSWKSMSSRSLRSMNITSPQGAWSLWTRMERSSRYELPVSCGVWRHQRHGGWGWAQHFARPGLLLPVPVHGGHFHATCEYHATTDNGYPLAIARLTSRLILSVIEHIPDSKGYSKAAPLTYLLAQCLQCSPMLHPWPSILLFL